MNEESFYIEAALNLELIDSSKFYSISNDNTVITSTDSDVVFIVTDQVRQRARYLRKLKEVRDVRTRMISETDWMFLQDSQVSSEDRQVWIDYRQALRDCPTLLIEGRENEFVYPTSPLFTDPQ